MDRSIAIVVGMMGASILGPIATQHFTKKEETIQRGGVEISHVVSAIQDVYTINDSKVSVNSGYCYAALGQGNTTDSYNWAFSRPNGHHFKEEYAKLVGALKEGKYTKDVQALLLATDEKCHWPSAIESTLARRAF